MRTAAVIAVAVLALSSHLLAALAGPILVGSYVKCEKGLFCFKEEVDLMLFNAATGKVEKTLGTIIPEERSRLIVEEYATVSAYSAANSLYFFAAVPPTGPTDLYTMSTATGATLHHVQIASPANISTMQFLESTQTLYMTDAYNTLYTVNPATGAATAVATFFKQDTFAITGPSYLDAKSGNYYVIAERVDTDDCWQMFGLNVFNGSSSLVQSSVCMPDIGILNPVMNVFIPQSPSGEPTLVLALEQVGYFVGRFSPSKGQFTMEISFVDFVNAGVYPTSETTVYAYDAETRTFYLMCYDQDNNYASAYAKLDTKTVYGPFDNTLTGIFRNMWVF